LTIAAVILLAAAWRTPLPRPSRRQSLLLAAAGAALAIHFACWIASLEYTTVAISTLLVATTPIWTAAYDAIALKRPPTLLALAAFAAGACGIAAVVGFNRTPPPVPGHSAWGAWLALTGGFAIAVYFVVVRGVGTAIGTRAIVTRTYAWAAVVLIGAAALARQSPPPPSNLVAWGGIAAMALISQLVGHTALNASLRSFTPSAVSFSSLLEPAIAAVLALAVFGERIAPPAIAGGLLLLGSIAVVLREEPSARQPIEP
jgi:drug/metabolite transporter (DMT)-like permease